MHSQLHTKRVWLNALHFGTLALREKMAKKESTPLLYPMTFTSKWLNKTMDT